MSFDLLSILSLMIIQPLQFVFEVIFSIAYKLTAHPGMSIIALSLIMNFLVLPLYKRADDMQEKQREKEEKLKKGIDHIKKSFTGDERMMILQTYYRQNNYKPTDALNGSISLLLEIPFFMAAYQFLSHLALLDGASLGPITNLGQPDAMFVIGGLTINVLPVLMTVVNIISSAIYLKGFPLKTKIQLYAMAIFFLVFLYDSPAGLVFYWTLNNVFSLVKNIFYKLKNPLKVLINMAAILGVFVLGFVFFIYNVDSFISKAFLIAVGILLLVPFIVSKLHIEINDKDLFKETTKYKNVLLAGIIITIFIGLYIPSSVLSSSPEEFMSLTYFHNPINYLIYTITMAFGFFVIWVGIFYWIANSKFKWVIEKLLVAFSFISIINFMFFGTNLGTLLPNLAYQSGLHFSFMEIAINIVVSIVVLGVVMVAFNKANKHIPSLLCIVALAFLGVSGMNISKLNQAVSSYQDKAEQIIASGPQFNLSKEGKNVIMIMLDRAMGSQVPYIFNEKPELLEKFDGFTHYSNTVSYGAVTNIGSPSVFGGYEYTPIKMNERSNELLKDKHNEALKVLPVLYDQNDYNVTIFDPSYANYTWVPDVSIYDEYPDIHAFVTEGRFNSPEMEKTNVENNYRNFFGFSLTKTLPLFLQTGIYDYGYYHRLEVKTEDPNAIVYTSQKTISNMQATGIDNTFMKSYNVISNMKDLTNIKEDASNNFLLMANSTTHEPMLLQTPDYVPSMVVNNTKYFDSVKDQYTINGKTLTMESIRQVAHYHVNMAAFLRIGEWLDYLRENGVYDNTKIILVADHGASLQQIEEMIHDPDNAYKHAELFYPLLMVKDFNAKGFKTSEDFMTNADAPILALKDTISHPINPFTGKLIDDSLKYEEPIYVFRSTEYETSINNGNIFLPGPWAIVKDDMRVQSNWTYIDEECVDPRK